MTAGARVRQNKKALGRGVEKYDRSTSLSKKSSKPRIFVQASEWKERENKKTRKYNFAWQKMRGGVELGIKKILR